MAKNNKEEKSLVPVKKRKRHLRKSIKAFLAAIGVGVAALFGGNLYKELNQRDIEDIEEISNDKELLKEYNVKQEDIKKFLECEKKFQKINKMSYEEVNDLLNETSETELNIHKEKIVDMFNKMSDSDKAKLAEEFEGTTNAEEIKRIYNVNSKEDLKITLGVYSGKDNMTVLNKEGEVLCRYTEDTYSPKEKTEFCNAINALGKIQAYDENFYEENYEEIKEALKNSFNTTNKIINKEYVFKDGKIEAVEPEKEDKKVAFAKGLKVDLENGYTIKANDEKMEEKTESKNTNNIQTIDDEEQEL